MTPEAAITRFLELGRLLEASPPVTGRQVFEKILTWYQDTRIIGAALEDEEDMLLLQSGTTRPMILGEATDIRGWPDSRCIFDPHSYRYIDITRQVFATGGDAAVEFDDVAVQMSFTLAFGQANGSEPSSTEWIASPAEIQSVMGKFMTPYVQSLMDTPAAIVSIRVFNCG